MYICKLKKIFYIGFMDYLIIYLILDSYFDILNNQTYLQSGIL